MAGPSCHNCIYSVCDPEAWLRLMSLGEPILPTCANHPQWPAQLHEVPGVPCKNYWRKPKAPQGDVRLIPLDNGFYAYVDAADYPSLSQWSWHMTRGGYAARIDKHRMILMHRQIMQPPKGKVVDHHDGNVANNCRLNLRVCNQRENRRNSCRKHGGRARFKGIHCCNSQAKIGARIRIEGRLYWLGYFLTDVEAARAYDRAAVEAFGEFARPNFPEEWPPERRRKLHAQYLRTGELSFIHRRVSRQRIKARKIKTKERKKDTRKTKAKYARRGESSFARNPHPPQRKRNRSPQRSHRGLRPQPNRS